MNISVVINTYNSERCLRAALESVKDFDEIVICDMHSSDSTIVIAEEYDAKIVYHDYVGFVEPARNFAISQTSNEWVLVLDSDERVLPGLKSYLYDFVNSAAGEHYSGLYIARRNHFMGRFMRGAYPNYILRLMRKSKTYWPETIHDVPRIDGLVAYAPRKQEISIDHLPDETVEQRIAKINNYTNKECSRRAGRKYSVIGAFFRAGYRFIWMYVFRGGFLDGRPGYINAMMEATYKFFTIAKIWEHDT